MQIDLFENNMNITLADPGEGPGRVGTPLLIFRPNWGPKGRKNFLETVPPYLRPLDKGAGGGGVSKTNFFGPSGFNAVWSKK